MTQPLTREEAHSDVPMVSTYGPSPDGLNAVMGASSYDIGTCGHCDHIHIWLRNSEGEFFASMTLDAEQIESVCAVLQKYAREIRS